MNSHHWATFPRRLLHRGRFCARVLDPMRRVSAFSAEAEADALGSAYVINLDRRPDRWLRVQGELARFSDRHGRPLSELAHRISAVDARHLTLPPDPGLLLAQYTLAEQLTVDPDPRIPIDDHARDSVIAMSPQEMAVALSHITVWQAIASGEAAHAVVLEDDVFMRWGFAAGLRHAWSALPRRISLDPRFDLLYLAYERVGESDDGAPRRGISRLRRPGVWEAAAYALSREGADKLLSALPAHGPIDLWLNLQFERLEAFTARRPLIAQRGDEPSTNQYSVLPVLSRVGVITRQEPSMPSGTSTPGPVVAVGDPGTGLTALATALSMLEYTCCSDLDRLPSGETRALLGGEGRARFNAYVNIKRLDPDAVKRVARAHASARFIVTSSPRAVLPAELLDRTLLLTPDVDDKWTALSLFLGLERPDLPWPTDEDQGVRRSRPLLQPDVTRLSADLRFDQGPWIVPRSREFSGVHLELAPATKVEDSSLSVDWVAGQTLDDAMWHRRDDTFPDNLTLFRPANVEERDGEAVLVLRRESTPVRELTSGAVATVAGYGYGSFRADIRPARVSGIVTGVFLHRNAPRQEIDIEFLGRDLRKMLVNVYYNPGPEGARLEHGYRGTPTIVDLGFDAGDKHHVYEIQWRAGEICWLVDGTLVHRRVMWDPTPVPDRPLEFNINLWHSRSTELAGRLAAGRLPARTSIRSICIRATPASTLR